MTDLGVCFNFIRCNKLKYICITDKFTNKHIKLCYIFKFGINAEPNFIECYKN